MENNKNIATENELTISKENSTAYAATSTDYSEDIVMPFRFWVAGVYGELSRKYIIKTNLPSAHKDGGIGRYIIQVRGAEKAKLRMYDYNGDEMFTKLGIKFTVYGKFEYNKEYHFCIFGDPFSTNHFEVRVDYVVTDCDINGTMEPHGNYLAFHGDKVDVCNDGVGDRHDDDNHQSSTAYMNGVLNADIHRYIVCSGNHPDRAKLLGCVGVAIRKNGRYSFGIVGDTSGDDADVIDEFSVNMVRDLGFTTDGGNSVSPKEPITTYIFTGTRKDSWDPATLNAEADRIGRKYFY